MPSKLVQTFDEFLVLIGDNHPNKETMGVPFLTSEVKLKILRSLWNAGSNFPRDWVKSSELLKLTDQKYFDRRIRELRDETGCDIETGMSNGQPAYRLNSTKLNRVQDRTYLSASQKKALLERFNYTCSVCSKQIGKGEKGLEADHKIPLIRGGGSGLENWQPLCISCNVSKRRSCQGCGENCSQCAWAYPEKFGALLTIRASNQMLVQLREVADRMGVHSQDVILEAVREYIKKIS